MKQTLYILILFLCNNLRAQQPDTLLVWEMRFNNKYTIQDTCNLNHNIPDTINIYGHVDINFDTITFSFKGSLRFYQDKYYLEFRDNEDNLVNIVSSLYKKWTIQRPEPPYDIYDTIIEDRSGISISYCSLLKPWGDSYPFLNVFFYRNGERDKHKLFTIEFALKDDKQKKKIN